MTQGKKAATHVVGLILALSLFVYAGKMAHHSLTAAKHVDLYFWGGITVSAMIAALVLVSMIYVAFGEEAARHGRRPRFARLVRQMDDRQTSVIVA
jgi:hypothetical protein